MQHQADNCHAVFRAAHRITILQKAVVPNGRVPGQGPTCMAPMPFKLQMTRGNASVHSAQDSSGVSPVSGDAVCIHNFLEGVGDLVGTEVGGRHLIGQQGLEDGANLQRRERCHETVP